MSWTLHRQKTYVWYVLRMYILCCFILIFFYYIHVSKMSTYVQSLGILTDLLSYLYVPAWLGSPSFYYHFPPLSQRNLLYVGLWVSPPELYDSSPFFECFNPVSWFFPFLDHSSSASPARSPSLHPCYQPPPTPYLSKTLVLAQLPTRLPINYLW